MFTPGVTSFIGKVPGSGNRSRPGSRRSSLLASGSGIGNSKRSGRAVGFSHGTSHGNSFIHSSQVVEETGAYNLETFGTTLPVIVTEILTLSERTLDVSVRISSNGWAWLVHGRRLIVWRYSKSTGAGVSAPRVGAICKELILPPSDLSHDAKLVNVFSTTENQTPSCLAASPEGVVRYWPSIAHEGSSQETSADLRGQECQLLTDVQPLGSVLATTTATVVLVLLPETSAATGGTHALSCRQLKPPQGILGGIGRRVSSLLFGGVASGATDAKLVQLLGSPATSGDKDPTEKFVHVLTSNSFQKWLLTQGDRDRMFYSCDLETVAKHAFATHAWGAEKVDPEWVKVWLLDMAHAGQDKISVLMAGHNPNISDQLHYALGTVGTATEAPPCQFRSFVVLKHSTAFKEAENGQEVEDSTTMPELRMKFLLPASSNYQVAYVLRPDSTVLCVPAASGEVEVDEVDLSVGGNAILGTGYSGDSMQPLLFTLLHGMITLTPTCQRFEDQASSVTMNESSMFLDDKGPWLADGLNMSVSQAGLENLTMSESKKDQLKAAFLLFCKRSFGQAASIIEDLFPPSPQRSELDSSLDRLVVSMSTDLIDDLPALDPRWLETLPDPDSAEAPVVGSTSSLLILHQLEDKQVALNFYINFLKEVKVWSRLSSVTVRDIAADTSAVLNEHCEKTVVAIALRKVHSEFQELVDRAIKLTLNNRKSAAAANLDVSSVDLTPQDHFYREISKIHEIFSGFQLMIEQDVLVSDLSTVQIVSNAADVNHVMVLLLKECLAARSDGGSNEAAMGEFVPWTCAVGPPPNGLRSVLLHQYRTVLEKVVPLAEDAAARSGLFSQLVQLCDLILDGYQTQLGSIPPEAGDRKAAVLKQYERDRESLIAPLLNHASCLEHAASLSEKYLEFDVLVRVCEMTNDNDRLDRYMDAFSDHNFAQHLFDWHLRQGKQSKLLQQRRYNVGRHQKQLGQFLQGHAQISWLHNLQTGDYGESASTLKRLADAEVEVMGRKKTMLSLAKLSALASGESEETIESTLNVINSELNVLTAQEQLPKCVLDSLELREPDKMKVLSPRDLIELYIGEENREADQVDFKKALELLDFVAPSGSMQDFAEEKEGLRLRIWTTAVLRDNWNGLDTCEPMEAIKETLFFKLVDFCYLQGVNLNDELPPVETLLAQDSLKDSSAKVAFLIQTGYEHIQRQLASVVTP